MSSIQYVSTTDRVKAWMDPDGSTLHIQFNNPARHNALSVDMWEAVNPLLAQAESDDKIRLVVFSGAGEKAFVSGADITQFEDMRAAKEAVTRYESMAEQALMGIYNFSKPTLACIRGYCIGGGVNVAMSCDIRISSADAVFSIPAARLGLGYRYSALKNLVDLVGPAVAKDLFFTARRIDAQEAHDVGLITRVCPTEKLNDLLSEYQQSLAANAPITVSAGKAIIAQILKPSPEIDHQMCNQLIRNCFESEDYAEGRSAFMGKRKPVFRGK
ncbi:enoyl-CoA hydratase/isomerase family protein [Polynucleobacter sp. Latsch14-2]|jgi:enoyl-CoA hydratase/carnithine racemase|uniref:enoyl-CoA hydratase n=1 Tax=Polynucleobacter sp. Latsch14-2 TaxID=2576920 RepID=UPI001C0B1204|nr:enoyl-CoA hydratase [Polynucleobacter sp. Latsch14-2]MBU3614196.1 enoyl-CoA hydratase/isomerase family protein [Polynucleobacter sp. Latsch14-2]